MTEPPEHPVGDELEEPEASEAGAETATLRSRARTGARVVMISLAVLLIVVGASALITNIFESSRSTIQRFGDDVDRLVIDSSNGEITVTAAGTTEIVVERDERYVFRRPSREVERSGSTLVLDDGCPSFNLLFLGGCRVDFRVTVPPGTALELDSSNGDITVEGISGGLALRTSNGDVDLDRVTGEMDAHTSNGSIVGRGLGSTSVQADTSNGRIALRFVVAPNRIVTESSNGDISLEVPDLAYRIDADTSNGDIDLDVVSDPDAARTIEASSSNGNIVIRRR